MQDAAILGDSPVVEHLESSLFEVVGPGGRELELEREPQAFGGVQHEGRVRRSQQDGHEDMADRGAEPRSHVFYLDRSGVLAARDLRSPLKELIERGWILWGFGRWVLGQGRLKGGVVCGAAGEVHDVGHRVATVPPLVERCGRIPGGAERYSGNPRASCQPKV